MIKKLLLTLLLIIIVTGGYFYLNPEALSLLITRIDYYSKGYQEDDLSSVVTKDKLTKFGKVSMNEIVGLWGKDLRKKDFSQLSREFLAEKNFDTNTKWPEEDKLPEGFKPDRILQRGMNPGLGVRSLHQEGITGKGIAVAVFDKPIYPEHNEFGGEMNYIRVAPEEEKTFEYHFHGIGCASVLAGDNLGVAPDANLYYFACPDNSKDSTYYYSLAIEQVIELNKSLKAENKIRLISISDAFNPDYKDYLKKAKEAGIYVIDGNKLGGYGFAWGGALPWKDKNNPENYYYSNYYIQTNDVEVSEIIVPGTYRTFAGTLGKDYYIYDSDGGFSAAIPYVGGLAALAWQIDSELTFEEIVDYLQETKTKFSDRSMVNPVEFIELIQNE